MRSTHLTLKLHSFLFDKALESSWLNAYTTRLNQAIAQICIHRDSWEVSCCAVGVYSSAPAVNFLPPSSYRGKQRRLIVEGRNPAPYGPQTDQHFIPLLQHYSECLSS